MESSDKGDVLRKEERFGYLSVHYLVPLLRQRTDLPEYRRFDGLVAEIQVRTILQHAWAEIEHDIQYKSLTTIPSGVRRRFMSLAGLLEIADREFQAVQDEDERIRNEAKISIQMDQLENVEITADALRKYLDKEIGPDKRIAYWSYDWCERLLRRIGVINFEQIDECISKYKNDDMSRVVYGSRQGQLERFELMLSAAMGANYLDRHPWNNSAASSSSLEWMQEKQDRMRRGGVDIGDYCPPDNDAVE
jgi:putative GTP pyrophosphokinase